MVTLNAWGLPFPIAWHPRRIRFPRIARFLREGAYHLAALQELWHGAPRLQLPGRLHRDDRHGDSGLALVSSLPVNDVTSRRFLAARGFDAWKQKGALRARVGTPAGEVTVISTHLQAGDSVRDARVRASQVDDLLAMLDDAPGAAVLLGDLNLHAGNPEDRAIERRLEAAGLRDAARATPAPTYRWKPERFDRILLRDGDDTRLAVDGAVAAIPPAFLSDHLPVEATLRLEAVARPQAA